MMDTKIKAALLGDASAAAEYTAAGIAIPCPFCGDVRVPKIGYLGTVLCAECGAIHRNVEAWNRRAPVQTEDNPPLTLEELREMDGEPVWNDTVKHWSLVDADNDHAIGKDGLWRPLDDRYYRRKPDKEGE